MAPEAMADDQWITILKAIHGPLLDRLEGGEESVRGGEVHGAWLANAHATLDRAVWAAYGWDDPDPATVDEAIGDRMAHVDSRGIAIRAVCFGDASRVDGPGTTVNAVCRRIADVCGSVAAIPGGNRGATTGRAGITSVAGGLGRAGGPVPPVWALLPSPLAVAVPPSRASATARRPVALAYDVPSVLHRALPFWTMTVPLRDSQ